MAEPTAQEINSGTKEVEERHRIDEAALARWLEANVEGYKGPLEVRQFKGGQSNPTYKLVTPSRSYVMRSKPGPVARLLPSAHAVEREYRVMDALAGTGVPVAKMHLLCEDESVIGHVCSCHASAGGRIMPCPARSGAEPAETGSAGGARRAGQAPASLSARASSQSSSRASGWAAWSMRWRA